MRSGQTRGLGDFRIYQAWHPGSSRGSPGPHLLSVNEYRPHRLRDVLPIARISVVLVRQVVEMEDAVGIVTSYQPLGRITYSLSVWKSEDALREFTVSRDHRQVMRDYRSRGYLRHIHWWGEHVSTGASMAEARSRLDAGEGRRVGEPRSRWARRDAELL
jgi:uncharacterized protein DUF3291